MKFNVGDISFSDNMVNENSIGEGIGMDMANFDDNIDPGFSYDRDRDYMEFNKGMIDDILRESKETLLKNIRYELMELIKEKAVQGISVFDSNPYQKHLGIDEANPYRKLTKEEIDDIINEFQEKGFNIKQNSFSRDVVKFTFKL